MLIDKDAGLCQEFALVLPHLQHIQSLYHALRAARQQRGAIDFDRTETRIVFGVGRKIEKIVPVVRNDAHRMIEEFMISANVAAAEFLTERKMPLVYRVHDEPGTEKLADVRSFMAELGLQLGGGDQPQAQDYRRLIDQVRDRPDRHLIETVLLRSLRQAMYSPENNGHFGLALEAYAHFTSPIRRYPDLLVHRAIRHVLAGGGPGSFRYQYADMEKLGELNSMTERRADEATRDVVDWLKCEYMMAHVGSDFDGIVTTVTGFGLFVELQDIYVEGLIHITELDNDYYHFDPVGHRLTGERSGRTYRVGDAIQVKVARVDLDDRKIDFVLPGSDLAADKVKKNKSGSKKSKEQRSKSGNAKSGKSKLKESGSATPSSKNFSAKKKRKRNKKKKE